MITLEGEIIFWRDWYPLRGYQTVDFKGLKFLQNPRLGQGKAEASVPGRGGMCCPGRVFTVVATHQTTFQDRRGPRH